MAQTDYESRRRMARIAGLWYFVMLVTGVFGLMYAPSRIIVAGNAAETAANLGRHAFLFRSGILANLLCQIAFVYLALSLYGLLAGVDKRLARMLVALVLVAVPIAFLNESFRIAAALSLGGFPYLGAFGKERLEAMALLFLDLHGQGVFLCGFFWGLWLLPFGVLAVRSGFIPRIIGILLIAGGVAYLIDSATAILLPERKQVVGAILMLPLALGEFSAIGWLLAKGVRRTPARPAVRESAGTLPGH